MDDLSQLILHVMIETMVEKECQKLAKKHAKKGDILWTLDDLTNPYHNRIPFKKDRNLDDSPNVSKSEEIYDSISDLKEEEL